MYSKNLRSIEIGAICMEEKTEKLFKLLEIIKTASLTVNFIFIWICALMYFYDNGFGAFDAVMLFSAIVWFFSLSITAWYNRK